MEPQNNNKESWSGIFDDFLNHPPTSSIFRLYLLSFLIWNKSVILYIIFHNQSMWDKLKNIYEFAPFTHNSLSFYGGPISLMVLIYIIVFIPIIKINYERKSLYDTLFYKHQTSLKKRLEKSIEIVNVQTAKIESEIKFTEKKEKLDELVGKDFAKLLEDIKDINLVTAINTAENIIYSKNGRYSTSPGISAGSGMGYISVNQLSMLDRLGLAEINKSNQVIDFTNKGKYYLDEMRKLRL